jgi:hypothetical protein
MAKIGSPLPIDQRKSVQEPVLLPATSRIGNNVGALKVDYMPYEIGEDNAKAQMAVTNEMTNMAFKMAEAYQITQDINKQYKVNLLEKDLQENDITFASEMAETRTFEEKNDVVERYRSSITDFGSKYNSIYPNQTPQEQRVGLDMLSRSLTKASTYETQAQIAQFTETNADLQLRLKLNSEEFGTKQSIDPLTQLRRGKELLGQMLKIKAITKNQHSAMLDQYIQDGYMNRSKLMGRNFGNQMAEGSVTKDYTKDKVLEHIGALVGVDGNLDKSRANEVYEAFTIAKTAKLRELNASDTANEQSASTRHRKDVDKQKLQYSVKEEDGTLTLDDHDTFISFLESSLLYGEKSKQNNRWVKWQNQRPLDDLVTDWTSQDGLIAREISKGTASGSDYGMYNTATNSYDVDKIDELMRGKGITHEPSIVAVKSFYRNTHKALSKGYNGGSQAKLAIEGLMKNLMGKGDSQAFEENWGVDLRGNNFDFKVYTKSPKGIVSAAKDEWEILQNFETEMIGAIQADIANAGGSKRVDQGVSLPHLSDFSNKEGKIKTPFYTEVDKDGNQVSWEQRTNTPRFRREFRQYLDKIQPDVRRQLRTPEYWEAAKTRRAKNSQDVDADTTKRKKGKFSGKGNN